MILVEMHKCRQPYSHSRHSVALLLPHFTHPSDLDQDPKSLSKFCTNKIIHKNSFYIECIYIHVDVSICR